MQKDLYLEFLQQVALSIHILWDYSDLELVLLLSFHFLLHDYSQQSY